MRTHIRFANHRSHPVPWLRQSNLFLAASVVACCQLPSRLVSVSCDLLRAIRRARSEQSVAGKAGHVLTVTIILCSVVISDINTAANSFPCDPGVRLAFVHKGRGYGLIASQFLMKMPLLTQNGVFPSSLV